MVLMTISFLMDHLDCDSSPNNRKQIEYEYNWMQEKPKRMQKHVCKSEEKKKTLQKLHMGVIPKNLCWVFKNQRNNRMQRWIGFIFFQIGLFFFCSLYFGANIINLSIWQIIIFELTATASFHLDKFKEFYSIYPDFNVDLCLQKHWAARIPIQRKH